MSFLVNIAKFLRWPVLKNICKWLLLQDFILIWSIKSNLAFAQTYSIKIIVSENAKLVNLKKKKKKKVLAYYVYLMFYYEILWFDQDFKSENLCFLNLYSVHAARILDLSLEIISSPSKWRMEHLYNCKGFFFMLQQVWYVYCLEA